MLEDKPQNFSGTPRPPVPVTPGKSIFGGLVFGLGILMMGLSGLCSGVWIFTVISESRGNEWHSLIVGLASNILAFGGIPFGIGFLLFWLGKRMLKK